MYVRPKLIFVSFFMFCFFAPFPNVYCEKQKPSLMVFGGYIAYYALYDIDV